MALPVKHVWSGATGTGDGSSRPNAYTSLRGGMNTNQNVSTRFIMYTDHTEPDELMNYGGGGYTWTQPAHWVVGLPKKTVYHEVVVTDPATGLYAPMPATPQLLVTTYNQNIGASARFAGPTIKADPTYGAQIIISGTANTRTEFYQALFVAAPTKALQLSMTGPANVWFTNSTVNFGTGGYISSSGAAAEVRFTSTTFAGALGTNSGIMYGCWAPVVFQGCDFTGLTGAGALICPAYGLTSATFLHCTLPATMPLMDANSFTTESNFADFPRVRFQNCRRPGGQEFTATYSPLGCAETSTSVYALGSVGLTDGITNLQESHKLTPYPGATQLWPLDGLPVDVVLAAGTYTVEFDFYSTFTAELTADDLFLAITARAAPPSAMTTTVSTRVEGSTAPFSAAGPPSWVGASGGVARKASSQFTVGGLGYVTLTPQLGRYESGKAVYINPKFRIATV